MGIILFFIAQITTPFFNILGLLYSLFRVGSFKGLNSYLLTVSISKDQHSNSVLKFLFNDVMTKKGGYHFGNPDQTLSYVFGKNKELKKLNWFGMFWANFLNRLENNHVENAVTNEENNTTKK